MNIYQNLSKSLELLKLNESQMSEEQFVQYAPELERLRKKIAADANKILCHFCLLGVLVPKNEQIPVINNICLNIRAVLNDKKSKDEMKRLSSILFKTYSLDRFLEAACDLRERVICQAYVAYWISKCEKKKVPEGWTGIKGEAWYNHVIDMYWHEEFCIWVSATETAWGTYLPPARK